MGPSVSPQKMMHLGVLANMTGAHPGGWRHPRAQVDADSDIDAFRSLARTAEAGKFDLFFLADVPAVRTEPRETWSRIPHYTNVLEPLTALSAIAGVTERIGLGGTASTSFYEPFNVARLFASLDQLSRGRAAWNAVTSATDYAARNFGLSQLPAHQDRYRRAEEFVRLVKEFWRTWDQDAFLYDRENAHYFDPEKLHPVRFEGEVFTIDGGALNLGRSAQGQPVIMQAGASGPGRQLAAETAEVVFSVAKTIEAGREYYDDVRRRASEHGRAESELKIMAGVSIITGETREIAQRRFDELQALLHPEVARQRLAMDLETDLSDLDWDKPIPVERIPDKPNLFTTFFREIADKVREGSMTLGEIATGYQRGQSIWVGSADEIADRMAEWFLGGATDGFILTFPLMPADLEDFVRLVVPILQERGLFREEYAGTTLREHLGLSSAAGDRG